ncbi:MAG: hypothetical protein N2C14_07420 [Planctomycetales bacterium]
MRIATCISQSLSAAMILGFLVGSPSFAAKPGAAPNGTRLYVKNGTNRAFTFELYVQTIGGKTGRFGRQITLEPGKTANWKLSKRHKVAAVYKDGKKLYRVGLIGVDKENGKRQFWGLIGGDGMFAHRASAKDNDNGKTYSTLVVNPVGKF